MSTQIFADDDPKVLDGTYDIYGFTAKDRRAQAKRRMAAAEALYAAVDGAWQYLEGTIGPCGPDCDCLLHDLAAALEQADGRPRPIRRVNPLQADVDRLSAEVATLTAERDEARQLQGFLERIDEVVIEHARAEAAEARCAALRQALELISSRHEGYQAGMGPCVCEGHVAARGLLTAPRPDDQEPTV
jgi:hypothetical protein